VTDEITPDRAPEPPAVEEPEEDQPVFIPDLPDFDASAPLPYAGGTGIPLQQISDEIPFEIQVFGQIEALNVKLNSVIESQNALIGRIDWIAPRVEWVRSTFAGLIDQFGKITPAQVISMLRGKMPMPQQPQEGKQIP
jgi:hypothetical protein